MKRRPFPLLVALAVATAATLALAQERAEVAAAAPLDPAISARVRELEAERRTAREAGSKDAVAWQASRAERAARHRARLSEIWGGLSGTLDGQAQLRSHANRMARLNRMLDLARQRSDKAMVGRIEADFAREIARFDAAMQALRAGGAQ